MGNITLNDGFKEFTINNDENKKIRFNPSDRGILYRINHSKEDFEKKAKELENEEDKIKAEEEFCKFVYDEIDYILNSKVSETLFGGISPLSTIKGVPYYQIVIEAIQPILEKEIQAEQKASEKRISKHTSKYKGSK